MDLTVADAVRDELYNANQTFRNLINKHQNYEKRLDELAKLTYPKDEELLEETTLKKKKLILKDEIHNMLQMHAGVH